MSAFNRERGGGGRKVRERETREIGERKGRKTKGDKHIASDWEREREREYLYFLRVRESEC